MIPSKAKSKADIGKGAHDLRPLPDLLHYIATNAKTGPTMPLCAGDAAIFRGDLTGLTAEGEARLFVKTTIICQRLSSHIMKGVQIMAKGNLPACLSVTLTHEGGWSDHPKDPGGATMKGVTLAVFRRLRPGATKSDLRAISDADLERIYRTGYWNPSRGDALPAGVDLAVFDFAVNSGVSRASKNLQAIVETKQDGVIGPATVEAVSKREPAYIVKSLCARRLSFVRGLKTWGTFGRGWSRRIADIEARGVKMAGASAVSLSLEGKAAAARSKAQNGPASGATAAGSGLAGGGLQVADVNWFIIAAVAVLGVALFALVKSRAKINEDRARAYEKISKEG